MHLLILTTALFFGTALSADATSVITLINTIQNNTLVLNADVQRFTGGVSGLPYALQIQQDAVIIDKTIASTVLEANASPPFGEPGSIDVSDALLNVAQVVGDTLANTTAKSDAFGDLKPIVLATLFALRRDTNQLGDAIVPKLGEDEQGLAPILIEQLNGQFDGAITAYGGTPPSST